MASNSSINPISVPFSGIWDGQNGLFPSFNINVGTPPQTLRLNASWNDAQIMLPLTPSTQNQCPFNASVHCSPTLDLNTSSTWRRSECTQPSLGNFSWGPICGRDTVGINSPGAVNAILHSQAIIGWPTVEFQVLGLGSLGLNPFSLDNQNRPENNLLSGLRKSQLVPSLSFGMSFGSQNEQNRTPSLVLGGYDASMFAPTGGFSFDVSGNGDDLAVMIRSIVINDAPNGTIGGWNEQPNIYASLDNTIPDMRLSVETCGLFKNKFGLIFDPTSERFLVNESQHNRLTSENPSISFQLSTNLSLTSAINITIPYNSFELQIGPPYYNRTQRYFPLSQTNGTEFALGMAFLRQIYLIVDYERKNFSIYRSISNPGPNPQISAIPSLSTMTNYSGSSTGKTSPEMRNTSHTIAGAATAAVCVFLLAAGLMLYVWRRRRNRRKAAKALEDHNHGKPEMEGTGEFHGETDGIRTVPVEVGNDVLAELQEDTLGSTPPHRRSAELEGDIGCSELLGASAALKVDQGKDVVELKTN